MHKGWKLINTSDTSWEFTFTEREYNENKDRPFFKATDEGRNKWRKERTFILR